MKIYNLDIIILLQFGTNPWSLSGSNCCFLTCIKISQEAGKVVWHSRLFKNFSQFVVTYRVKGFGVINKQKYMFIWHYLAFSMIQWMLAVWSLVPLPFLNPAWTSASLNLNIHGSCTVEDWLGKFWVLLGCMWDECNCVVVGTFFGIAFLWDWNENWPFPVQ